MDFSIVITVRNYSRILSTGVACPIACWDTHTPSADTPWADTPLGRHHLGRHPLTRPLQRTVRILLKCILVLPVFHLYLFLISFPILLTFQSLLDFAVSVILLLKTLTVKDTHFIHSSGLRGEIECRLWNTELFLWGLFDSSIWNLVQITIER